VIPLLPGVIAPRPMPDLLDEIGDAGQCGKFISFPVD